MKESCCMHVFKSPFWKAQELGNAVWWQKNDKCGSSSFVCEQSKLFSDASG